MVQKLLLVIKILPLRGEFWLWPSFICGVDKTPYNTHSGENAANASLEPSWRLRRPIWPWWESAGNHRKQSHAVVEVHVLFESISGSTDCDYFIIYAPIYVAKFCADC